MNRGRANTGYGQNKPALLIPAGDPLLSWAASHPAS